MEPLTEGPADIRARALGDTWRRISRRHLSSGQGCACGFGGGLMLQGADFELDIVEFVIDDARKAGLKEVEPFIDAVSKRGPDRYSLPDLIEALGRDDAERPLPAAARAFALDRLARVLGSMDAAHAGGRFACD
ncbi:MAG TPA: hypothetical protein VIL72_13205 [Beijerinckiaceae bacterium]